MGKIALLFAMIFLPAVVFASVPDAVSPPAPVSKELKKQLLGTPVYLQIFKEERTLELYGKIGNAYRLLDSYRICNFGNDSNLLIVFYVQIMPDDFVMQLHRF